MLGLGSVVTKEEGYAKGERYRERWLGPVGAYNAATNPIGHNGHDYIGDFTSIGDIGDFVADDATPSIALQKLKVTADETNGNISIFFRTLPGTFYTFAMDIAGISSGACIVLIGTSATDGTYHNSGNITSTGSLSVSFKPTADRTCLTLITRVKTAYATYDNISLKET
jgi:hypothetical protein